MTVAPTLQTTKHVKVCIEFLSENVSVLVWLPVAGILGSRGEYVILLFTGINFSLLRDNKA